MNIFRTYSRTERDDYVLNVEPHVQSCSTNYEKEAVELKDSEGKVIGWKIQPKYD